MLLETHQAVVARPADTTTAASTTANHFRLDTRAC